MNSPADTKTWIVQAARRLGFDLVGVTSPEPPPHLNVLDGWIEAGRHGSMAYMARPDTRRKRADPRQLLPTCQAIVVVGMNYLPRDTASAETAPAKVATYAVGDDYHLLITERLQSLVDELAERLGRVVEHRIAVDSAPVLERELAQRAGLGWIGKNTCVIHPQAGSYFFLGELLLDVSLPFDDPMQTDHCGTCTRCLDACPTDCILPNRTLDSRRCISYLTIEHRGAIDVERRSDLHDWVFGCDICQQVCPWNVRFARPSPEPAFQARPGLDQLGVLTFLALDQTGFDKKFQHSPLKRAKRVGLVRNAAVVAGNQRVQPAVDELLRLLLSDDEPLVRSHAAWALGRIGGAAAANGLRAARQSEEQAAVRAEIRAALESLAD